MQAEWTPLFWEPVEGTGERLMAGVVLNFDGNWAAHRMLRDDVLDSLYGKASGSPRKLIDEALNLCLSIAVAVGANGLASIGSPLMGLHAGVARTTVALSLSDALKQVALMHTSLAKLDAWDDLESFDTPAAEEVGKRFTTEVREIVFSTNPELNRNFNRSTTLVNGGMPVRFGFFSDVAVLHFSVVNAVRQAAGVRDARARLWELAGAKETSGIGVAALISAFPRDDDATLGARQREALRENKAEIEREADNVGMRFYPVSSAREAAIQLLAIAA